MFWLVATIIDILIGYKIGVWTQNKFKETKFLKKVSNWAEKIEEFIGRRGENFAIICLGIINFPYANAFIGSWLKQISRKKLYALIFIGDSIYWIIAWCINIGVRMFVSDTLTALYIVVGLGLMFAIFSKALLKKILSN